MVLHERPQHREENESRSPYPEEQKWRLLSLNSGSSEVRWGWGLLGQTPDTRGTWQLCGLTRRSPEDEMASLPINQLWVKQGKSLKRLGRHFSE